MEETYLAHHGVKGQKWGVRRYQNSDGSLTSAGKKKYDSISNKYNRQLERAHRYNESISSERARNRLKIQRKIERLEEKQSRKLEKYSNSMKKKASNREKRFGADSDRAKRAKSEAATVKNWQTKAQAKYDKKISKQQEKLKDFDIGTKYVKAGQKRYEDTIKNYRDVQLKSITDSNAKKSRNARYVINQYQNQRINDLFGYGQAYEVLTYASEYGRQHYDKDSKK